MRLLITARDCPFFSSLSRAYKKYAGGGGGGGAGRSKADVSFFQNSKMTAITSLFYCSFTRTRLGGGREYAKGVRFVRL